MNDLETYMRQRNLKLIGFPEVADENIHLEVVKICQAVPSSKKEKLPEVIDAVYRLGKPQQGSGGGGPRATIMQFSMRSYREANWKAAKNSYFCDNGLQFKEDRKNNKVMAGGSKGLSGEETAYFVGARAFVQGEDQTHGALVSATLLKKKT